MRLSFWALASIASAVLCTPAYSASFTVTFLSSVEFYVIANHTGPGLENGLHKETTVLPTSIPFSDTIDAVSGTSSAYASIDLSNTVFEMNFDLMKGVGSTSGTSASATGGILFSVDQPVNYLVEGRMETLGPAVGGSFNAHTLT